MMKADTDGWIILRFLESTERMHIVTMLIMQAIMIWRRNQTDG